MKIKHPATYSPAIVEHMVKRLEGVRGTLLDPFAGPGVSLAKFVAPGRKVIGIEIEQPNVEAGLDALTDVENGEKVFLRVGDATILKGFRRDSVAMIVTSPVYGNRMSDSHKDQGRCRSCKGTGKKLDGVDQAVGRLGCPHCGGTGHRPGNRRSYTHDMREMTGDPEYVLAENNAGKLHYGKHYQELHRAAYRRLFEVAAPGCVFLLNVSDFERQGKRVDASVWHLATCVLLGWEWRDATRVETRRMRFGANREKRVDGEWIIELRKPEKGAS